jgi:hypothetical protein
MVTAAMIKMRRSGKAKPVVMLALNPKYSRQILGSVSIDCSPTPITGQHHQMA